jgi:formylglycine-generating enzyme required for sulfatase activity
LPPFSEGKGQKTSVPASGKAPPAPAPRQLPKTLELPCGKNVTITLALIPAGEFKMGSDNGEANEKPVHRVRITKPFYLGIHEVTQAQFETVMPNLSQFQGADRPADFVSLKAAQQFCENLSDKTGKKVRVPTEAEWEYACRAGATAEYYFGDDPKTLGEYAWHAGNSGGTTHPVGMKKANAFGLYDMLGNVWEWCSDWHDPDYYKASPVDDPPGASKGVAGFTGGQPKPVNVLRGGFWNADEKGCRCATRSWYGPDNKKNIVGFRIVCEATP